MSPAKTFVLLASILFSVVVSSSLEAQNLLANPGFDTDLSHWALVDLPEYDFDWRSRDADGSATSGSIRFLYVDEEATSRALGNQCVAVSPGVEYELQGHTRIGGSSVGDGMAGLGIFWFETADCTGFIGTNLGSKDGTPEVWVRHENVFTSPANARGARVTLSFLRSAGPGEIVTFYDNVYFAPKSGALPACVPDDDTLCIDDNPGDRRFRVEVSYDTAVGGAGAGDGKAIPLDSLDVTQGGLFWFFNKRNPEMLVKVLDGCGTNGHYWVFYAAVTNIAFEIEVKDTLTGATWTRSNPDRNPAEPQQDTFAFPCS